MHFISKRSPHFPKAFDSIVEPIDSFYFEGSLDLLKHNYISVVGARKVLPWVEQWLEYELMPSLGQYNIGVVSGGAIGVDQVSHICALRADVPTLAVLPSGLNQKYPSRISQVLGGSDKVAYMSEYSPDEKMRKHHFYKRNRLIAALSPVTLVIQAAEKSGTMITAQYALQQGKTIATLPSHPMDQLCAGNLKLLYEGALMIRNQKDLEALIEQSFSSSFYARKRTKLEEVQ